MRETIDTHSDPIILTAVMYLVPSPMLGSDINLTAVDRLFRSTLRLAQLVPERRRGSVDPEPELIKAPPVRLPVVGSAVAPDGAV